MKGQTLIQVVLFISLLLLAAGIALRYIRDERVASGFSERFGKKLTDTVEETDERSGEASAPSAVRIKPRSLPVEPRPEDVRPAGQAEPADAEYRGVERRKESPPPKP